MAEYKAKRAEYKRVQATLPSCPRCGDKLSKTRADQGHIICGECDRRQEENRVRLQKIEEFHSIEDIDQLKEWIYVNLWNP